MFDLHTYLLLRAERINEALEAHLPSSGPSDRILEAMRHSLMAGGKRIRPVLCLAAAEAVGGTASSALGTACALEMVHTYSLIHDDLPAMDDDRLRRGRPTCHVAFDEATAILAGDALLTLAFEVLASQAASSAEKQVPWTTVILEIALAAGCRGMIAGQMLDMQTEGRRLARSEIESMHALKTGAMIRASLRCGAMIGGAGESDLRALTIYAENVGLAFQVADDILNVEGDPSVMGKAAGTDRQRLKNAYPALLGLDRSRQLAAMLVDKALEAINGLDRKAEALRAVARYVINRRR